MKIEDAFPDDPFEPTVKYVASSQVPFAVPWATGRVQLGTGFNSQRAESDPLFLNCSPFRDIQSIPLGYRDCQTTSIKDESATDVATSSVNSSFSISASVGGSFLGASGRGSYEKRVRDDNNTSNITVHAEHICGQIDAINSPSFDKRAKDVLLISADPIAEFHKTYGDFYLAGYRVGAINSTRVSGHMVNKMFFEAKRAEIEIKVVFRKRRKSINDTQRSENNSGGLTLSAYDSLGAISSNFTAHTAEDGLKVSIMAAENKDRAMNIASRAAEILFNEFFILNGCTMFQDLVDRLCDRGLITELLLAPYCSLREYQSILSFRYNKHCS